jgi:hypothetical protein
MIDWSACPAVTSRPGYLAGRPALRDDPRVPPEVIIDNMDLGESAQDVISNYDLKTPLSERDEAIMLNNALNEVCNGVHISDAAFSTRLGWPRLELQKLLDQIYKLS